MDHKNSDSNSEPIAGKRTMPNSEYPKKHIPDSDFVVTEAQGRPQQLVGEEDKQEDDNELGIQSPQTLMNDSAKVSGEVNLADDDSDSTLIEEPLGSSSSILVPEIEPVSETNYSNSQSNAVKNSSVKHLSEQEVIAIRSKLYSEPEAKPVQSVNQSPVSAKPSYSQTNFSNDNQKPFGNTPIEPKEKQSQKSTLSENPAQSDQVKYAEVKREQHVKRKVAHFYNNFIHLHSTSKHRENDEFTLHNNHYVLKKKHISPALVLGISAPFLVIIAVFVIGLFVGGDTGVGRVVGVVVDDYGVPYGGGATIKFTDLGLDFRTDVQGLFTTDRLPTGSHKVEYLVAGTVVGSEYVTIVENDITKLILAPTAANDEIATDDLPSPVPATPDYSAPPATNNRESGQQVAQNQSPVTSKPKKAVSKDAKLVLSANVEGATLKIDGKVIGIGNTTYPRISPGKHQYTVTRKGFDSVSGEINLKAGGRKTLEVVLSPISEQAKSEIYSAEDYFYSGEEFTSSGNLKSAIEDYTKAIDINPGYAQAYVRRGHANLKTGQKRPAFDDYLRAGEIYQIQRTHSKATSAFSNAIEIYPKAIEPLLGRGHTHLARGENIAAITDFESAVDLNKNNPAARFGLGVARFNHGQYKKATNEFKKARSIDPGDPATHQYLMLSYLARNDTKNVKKSYKKFMENASDDQIVNFHSDRRFTAVVRIVEMEK